jgi:hypothetical protein
MTDVGRSDDSTAEAGAGRRPGGEAPSDIPSSIGRYRVEGVLGEGSFGKVYLALDGELRRRVAIKVPHRRRITRPEDMEAYLREARVLASLRHPHIVTVFDVGTTADGLCYVVSEFVEGKSLEGRIREGKPPREETASLVATVADALHYAHKKGLVHRDVKPGNILLDEAGKAYVCDFGLALREEDLAGGADVVGTPAYMSPEQIRGEWHLIDGRSDVFSLGVVLYELLAGRRPFTGGTLSEVLIAVARREVRPPRQVDDTIPPELERICLRALAKRASDRYTTALDLSQDLRHWLSHPAGAESASARLVATAPAEPGAARPKVVPKGLRSFEAADADFFLELLPGARDRNGLPETLRFWKTRIEEEDAEETFRVGVLYGPSGCGKSSLVKAGLLPRLSGYVDAVYLEATASGTEARLSKALAKRCGGLGSGAGLPEIAAAIRRGRASLDQKVFLVLDQFEQWLHGARLEEDSDLVRALRQCDGARLQCLILVRDDFWIAVTRFLEALEIELLSGHNAALVDLFDPNHACRALAEFGRAYGRLPENLGRLTMDQRAFLDQAVEGIAEDGRVVPVRLSLFAEMVKGKPWAPATLREVGGAAGVGVAFLEEAFGF